MYTLNLDTLSPDRLRRATDPETYRLGESLFQRAVVEITGISDFSAQCVVLDKRNYHVQLKVSRDHIYLQCSCRHASRGLICEHEVASWLEVHRHLERQAPAAWQSFLGQVIDSAISIPRSNKPGAYLLAFSLQPDLYEGPPNWKVVPYTLSGSAVPEEGYTVKTCDRAGDLQALFESRPELAQRVRVPHHALKPEDCLNCTPDAVHLANAITDRNHFAQYYDLGFPLESYLSLVRATQSPLFRGDPANPLEQALHICKEAGQARLNIDQDELGLHLYACVALDGQPEIAEPAELTTQSDLAAQSGIATQHLGFEADQVQVISASPPWLVAGTYLFELANPSGVSLISNFKDTPELLIPAGQQEDFIDQYWLDLARQFPLSGNAVTWEDAYGPVVPRLYLSDNNGELQVQLRFGYDQAEVRYDPDLPTQTIQRKEEGLALLRIHRQPGAEKAAGDQIASSTFGLKRTPYPSQPGQFRLRARTHPVDFLLNSVPRLADAGFEIYGEEQLKLARVNRNTPTISFSISSGIDWFDVQTAINFGEIEVSLGEVRRALRKRERYIKLADGSIGEIPVEWLERYKHLFALGEVTEEGLRLSRAHITLIDQVLEGANQARVDAEFERRRARLKALTSENFQGITPRPLPPGFIGELRPYQKAGFDWLHFLREFEFGGCLADDMGLGKTVQALTFLESLYNSPDTPRPEKASLLVVPRSLLVNWQRESARFTPNLRLLEFFETDRIKDTAAFDQVDLVITTYGVMLRDIQLLHSYAFNYAILDESQSIKNPLSQTARAAHLLQAKHRLVLTGTPIENSTAELWSQFAFLNPGLLGNLNYFKNEFGAPIEKKSDENAARSLRKLVYPFILRRTKDQVAPELPPRTERILYCDMDAAQRKLYNRTRDYFRGMLLGMLDGEGTNGGAMQGARMKILEGLLRLRQISNHPLLVDEKFHGTSGKFELLIDTLETLRCEGHKALVFSQFVQMLNLVRREMDTRQIAYNYLDGQTQARQEQVDIFQADPSIPFFLISLKAGGLGLNLTAADYVIHIDPWWNPAVEMQASDRTHRIGQDKPVFVFKLIARDSVEEKILLLQDRKKSLVDQIITTESAFLKTLTLEDINYLFSDGESHFKGS